VAPRADVGGKKSDAITNEQVQRLKLKLVDRSPKTVNNVLMLFRTVLKKAVEWGELERLPCTVTMLSCPKSVVGFFDFIDYEHLVVAAQRRAPTAHLMVLFGGDAGLRLEEMSPRRSIQPGKRRSH
jgi:hypothetical protein